MRHHLEHFLFSSSLNVFALPQLWQAYGQNHCGDVVQPYGICDNCIRGSANRSSCQSPGMFHWEKSGCSSGAFCNWIANSLAEADAFTGASVIDRRHFLTMFKSFRAPLTWSLDCYKPILYGWYEGCLSRHTYYYFNSLSLLHDVLQHAGLACLSNSLVMCTNLGLIWLFYTCCVRLLRKVSAVRDKTLLVSLWGFHFEFFWWWKKTPDAW